MCGPDRTQSEMETNCQAKNQPDVEKSPVLSRKILGHLEVQQKFQLWKNGKPFVNVKSVFWKGRGPSGSQVKPMEVRYSLSGLESRSSEW